MNELLKWLVGIAVPLTVVFSIYINWLNNFLAIKNAYSNCQTMSDICKGYVITKLHVENVQKNKVRWLIFGSRYIDLLNYQADKLLDEIDMLKTFEISEENNPLFHRHSFLDQWKEIDRMLLTKFPDNKTDKRELRKYLGEDPFGWMRVIIEGKIFELYRKYVLHILRTNGIIYFNEIITMYDKVSSLYPQSIPMYAICDSISRKIIIDSRIEIAERIWHEFNANVIQNLNTKEAAANLTGLTTCYTYKLIMHWADPEIHDFRAHIENYAREI